MSANQAIFSIRAMCRVLEVSASGYYAWRRRMMSVRGREDEQLQQRIRTIHLLSRQTYGAPRIHAELQEQGTRIGRKRVARLMKASDLQGVSRRKRTVTTHRDRSARPAPDLVDRQFSASRPNVLWVADITYVPTWCGFLYLAVVLDVWSRKIVGWAMATHLRTSLVTAALNMAIARRSPGWRHSSLGSGLPSTRRSSSANDVEKPAFGHRWDRSATASTMRCARASSPRSSAN